MAWIEREPSGQFHVAFRFGARKYKRSLKTTRRHSAEQLLGRVERRLELLESGDIELPPHVDLPTFLLTDGKRSSRVRLQTVRTLSELFEGYRTAIAEGPMEANSQKTAKTHLNHLQRILGARLDPSTIDLDCLQRYVSRRKREPGRRGAPVSPTTIRKEMTTFSATWKWARQRQLVNGPFPNLGLQYPKEDVKPPFMTSGEIRREIELGGMNNAETEELWDCLYLMPHEVASVLAYARDNSRHSFLYPMLVTAAHTGARRSELIRSQIGDVDLSLKSIRIRERKRNRQKRTYRTIPLSPLLCKALRDWLGEHPGSRPLFFLEESHSLGSKDWTTPVSLTVNQATDHFRRTFSNSEWQVLRGWHVFRHSFASNCASAGVDQRLIDEWMGHQTEEMVKRYRHLCPNTQASALAYVFG